MWALIYRLLCLRCSGMGLLARCCGGKCSPHVVSVQAITKHRASTLRWCHNRRDSVSNHQPHDCLLNCLFTRISKKTSKLRVTGLCVGNSPGTGEFPAQMASNAENVSIWWRHHDSLRRRRLFSIRIPIINLSLRFIMGIPIAVRRCRLSE